MMTKEQILKSSQDEFMNREQLRFIRELLLEMRRTIYAAEPVPEPARLSDQLDQAWQEEQWMIQLKRRAQKTDLLSDIDKALHRVNIGEYGYCELSGEPIDINRLLANPVSRTTIEEQTRLEQLQRGAAASSSR